MRKWTKQGYNFLKHLEPEAQAVTMNEIEIFVR